MYRSGVTLLVAAVLTASACDQLRLEELLGTGEQALAIDSGVHLGAASGLSTATVLMDGRVLIVGGTVTPSAAHLYDPLRNSMTAVLSTREPRSIHAATLLHDGRVLITGGSNAVVGQTTEFFLPDASTFVPGPNMAQSRHDHVATRLKDGRVLVSGGRRASVVTSASELFDPVTNSWSDAGQMLAFHDAHCAVLLEDGRVFVAGGNTDGGATSQIELWDPSARAWSDGGQLLAPRRDHACFLMSDYDVRIFGGRPSSSGAAHGFAERYDPATGVSIDAGAAAGHFDFLAQQLPEGSILLAGGPGTVSAEIYSSSFSPAAGLAASTQNAPVTVLPTGRLLIAGGNATDAVTLYESRLTFSVGTAPLPVGSADYMIARLPDGRVLLAGGRGDQGALAASFLYAESGNRWTDAGMISVARELGTATLLWDGRVLVAGGRTSANVESAAVDFYAPATNSWSPGPPMPEARLRHTATLLPDGTVLVVGGELANQTPRGAALLFDPVTNAWTDAGILPLALTSHQAVLLPDGDVAVIGGRSGGGAVDSITRFNRGSGFTSAALLPDERLLHASVLDTSGAVLTFAGFRATPQASVFSWNPQSNLSTTVSTLTAPRENARAITLFSGDVWVTAGLGPQLSDRFRTADAVAVADVDLSNTGGGEVPVRLPSNRVLLAGGLRPDGGHPTTVRRYDEGLTTVRSDLFLSCTVSWPGGAVVATGSADLIDELEGHGGTPQASAANHSVFRFERLEGGHVFFGDARYQSTAAATLFIPPTALRGWYEVRAIANGVPTRPVAVRLASPPGAPCRADIECGSGSCAVGICAAGGCTLIIPDGGVVSTDGGVDDGGADGGDDAGAADGGASETDGGELLPGGGGSTQRLHLTVGCDCSVMHGGVLTALLAVCFALRARRRSVTL